MEREVRAKGAPPLRRLAITRASSASHVAPHGAWRHPDAKFELQFRGYPLLTHVGFAQAIAAIMSWTSTGSLGRPLALDFHRQKSRKPFRCHRISVSGFTMMSAAFQSINRASTTSVMRVASVAQRHLTRRSAYRASCFRNKRLSAASLDRERSPRDRNISASTSRWPAVRHAPDQDDRFCMRQHAMP